MEHRTSPDDIVPPWYKRGSYLLILAILLFIVVYAFYLLVLAPKGPAGNVNASQSCQPACGDAGYLVQVLLLALGL